jgi:hypothetical protein
MSRSKHVAFPRWAVPATVLVALVLGCGGGGSDGPIDGGGGGPIEPTVRIFSFLSLTPASATICTMTPGNVVNITAAALDQSGQPMTGLGNPSFTNSNPSAATVDANGLVTGLAQGTAQITASLTANGTTRTAEAVITVASVAAGDVGGSVSANHPLPHIAVITAVQLSAGVGRTLNIQGEALHSHTLTLTGPQMMQIAAGCRTSQESSRNPHSDGNGDHSHTVAFN